jgi:hypothetical protein
LSVQARRGGAAFPLVARHLGFERLDEMRDQLRGEHAAFQGR